MTKLEYLEIVRNLRKKISVASVEDLVLIEAQLDLLYKIKPVRTVYFFARAEFMIKSNVPKKNILQYLREKVQLYYSHKELRDFFRICENLLPEDDFIGRDNYRFQAAAHDGKSVDAFYAALNSSKKDFLNDSNSLVKLQKIAEEYYITQNPYIYFLAVLSWCKLNEKFINFTDYIREDVLALENIGLLLDLLMDEHEHLFFVLADTTEDMEDCEIVSRLMKILGQSVYMIGLPVICEVEAEINLLDTVSVSLENIERHDKKTIFHPIQLLRGGEIIGDNRSILISHIMDNIADHPLAVLLCSGKLLDELQLQWKSKQPFHRLSEISPDVFSGKMSVAWTGCYLNYISRLYKFDAHEKIEALPACEFSIVIPAKDSAKTLRYTLQTCLEQRFRGSYEILLSDNSSEGNTEVYDLYVELNDSRIRYIKPARDLTLVRSFESAFLQAKGEFVFSIGSDDGVLPWALEALDVLLKKHPEEDLFLWRRGFYAWPGFNGGQQHQFVVPDGNFQRGNYEAKKIATYAFLDAVMQDPKSVYILPNIYINSGYRKKYLHKLLDKTGRLWDGGCQDIYMGVVNCVINEELMMIDYPLTIAGMANSSIGYSNVCVKKTKDISAMIHLERREPYCSFDTYANARIESLLPSIGLAPRAFYNSILRLILSRILSRDLLCKIDWKKIYIEMASLLSLEDVLLEKKLGLFRYSAQCIGPEMLTFVEKCICKPFLSSIKYSSERDLAPSRTYQIEKGQESGGMILDASEFDVSEIHGAVRLFEKLTRL